MSNSREQAAVLALAGRTRRSWHLLSHALEEAGTALNLAAGERPADEQLRDALAPEIVADEALDALESTIADLAAREVRLVTVLDAAYPTNLRLVYDRPPFLFIWGDLRPDDERAVAVVGTRGASEEGLRQANALAAELAKRRITVLSGLALGIDGAAHRGALAGRGRTVAVIGNGITHAIYPAAHRGLADEIVRAGGAVVSQFLPDSPPRRVNFPLRNRTMSGLALGTVVVEAGSTSGAKMQAGAALEHGKRLFLVEGLVTKERWADELRGHPGVTFIDSASDVADVIDSAEVIRPATLLVA